MKILSLKESLAVVGVAKSVSAAVAPSAAAAVYLALSSNWAPKPISTTGVRWIVAI
jgi:hypothetical protein